MEEHFMQIIEGKGHGSDLTSGQMLLMGFNGLFTRLDDEFSSMLETVDGLNVPDIWKKVDAVREARSMQVIPFSDECVPVTFELHKIDHMWIRFKDQTEWFFERKEYKLLFHREWH